MRHYNDQLHILSTRRSYSKTDTDATFMKTKDDHLGKAPPRPCYNVQIGTSGQYVVGYSIHQTPNDSVCLVGHLERASQLLGRMPGALVADGGYGSLINYRYLEGLEAVVGYVKDQDFNREVCGITGKRASEVVPKPAHWPYEAGSDTVECPAGYRLELLRTEQVELRDGSRCARQVYHTQRCAGCGLRKRCNKGGDRKHVYRIAEWVACRDRARQRLCSPEGQRLRRQRGPDVESVFGQIKHNMGYRRFLLRGAAKVHVEWGLLSVACNLKKMARSLKRA